jgi:hypothetical protein
MTVGDGASRPGAARPARVSFFDEQARRRRAAGRLTFVCLAVASGVGILLSAAVTPLLLLPPVRPPAAASSAPSGKT